MSVEVSASDWSYDVMLYNTPTSLPLNSPELNNLSSDHLIADFGGTEYKSASLATADLDKYIGITPSGTYTVADLGNGIIGHEYEGAYQDLIQWQRNAWTLQVYGGTTAQNQAVAQSIIQYLHTTFLPVATGRLSVDIGQTTGTTIGWLFGEVLYTCDGSDTLAAVHMATSMREYPGYQLTP